MKRILAIALSLILLFGVCGCKKTPQEVSSGVDVIYEYEYEYEDAQGNIVTSNGTSSKKDKETSSKANSKNESSNGSYSSTEDDYVEVDDSGDTVKNNSIITGNNSAGKVEMGTASADASQSFWDNINSYVIIYAKDDNYTLAERLSKYFENMGITIPIYKDTKHSLSENEILVGDTNRYSTGAAAASYKVRLVSGKLRFEGNNYSAVEVAVTKFLEKCAHNQPLPTIDGELAGYQQPITVNGKAYNYVWGDEFEDSSVDFTESDKWNITHMMGYYNDFEVAPKEKISEFTYAKDGKLVLTAGKFDFTNYVGQKNLTGVKITSSYEYANGGVLTTSERMVYRRGYAELRASVPTNNGSWPAWWMRSTGGNLIKYEDGTTNLSPIYTLEVDIFECYSSLGDRVQPNLHKWYKNTIDQVTYNEVYGYDGKKVTSRTEMKSKGVLGGNEDYQFSTAISKTSGWQQYSFNKNGSTSEDWHTYGFLWTDKTMDYIIDGVTYFSIDLTKEFDGFNDGKYGYNQYMYFLLDNHIYTPAAKKSSSYSSNLPNPMFEIEYIRLYQLDGERDIILSE